jgi:hypothetical protein
MVTPQISGKYQFQVDLKGLCLPITFTVPDIPDALPSEEHSDQGPSIEETQASFEETCDSTVRVETDKLNLLHVGAYILCERTTGHCMVVEHGNRRPQQDDSGQDSRKGDKVPVVLSAGGTYAFGQPFQYSGHGETSTTITAAGLRHLHPCF